MKRCHACGKDWDGRGVGATSVCDCGADAHVCRNCRLFIDHGRKRCTSSTTEPPADPNRNNYCEEFEWREGDVKPAAKPLSGDEARKKFNSLFGE